MATTHTGKSTLAGYGFVLWASLSFALIGPISRFPLSEGVSSTECAFWRAFLGGIFFAFHGFMRGAWQVTGKQRLVFSLFGIPGVGLYFFLYTFAIDAAGAAATSVLNNTAPIWVAVWAYLFFNEAMTASKITSILLVMAGAALITVTGGGLGEGGSMAGLAAAAASGFIFSLHSLMAKKYLSATITPVSLYMHIMPIGALCLFPFVDFMPDKSLEVWLSLLAIGFFCNSLAYMSLCFALERLQATRVSVLETATEPLLSTLFAFIWWGEIFTGTGWLGVALVLVAVLMIVSGKEKIRPPKQRCTESRAGEE